MEKYKDEVKQRWRDSSQYEQYLNKTKDNTKDKWDKLNNDMFNIFIKFNECMKNGVEPFSLVSQNLVQNLQDHITYNYYVCTNEILAGLGQMYVSDERFKSNIDSCGLGTAEYVASAINIYCKTNN